MHIDLDIHKSTNKQTMHMKVQHFLPSAQWCNAIFFEQQQNTHVWDQKA